MNFTMAKRSRSRTIAAAASGVRATRQKPRIGFRSVLCPVDFSERARLALRYAAAIAEQAGGALHVTYAADPLLVRAAGAALGDRTLTARSLVELRQFTEDTLGAISAERLRVECRVSIGDPPAEALKAALRARSDLIVLGTHGLSGAGRLLAGSTTLGVLQQTTVPVLVVPWPPDGSPDGVPASWPGERIVAAIDLSSDAEDAVEAAAGIAKWFGAELLLIHAVSPAAAPEWFRAELGIGQKARIEEARRVLSGRAAAVKGVRTAATVVEGHPADAIVASATTARAGLIITTLHNRRGWFGSKRGAISYELVARAVAPVLALPPSRRPR
jgi:nucleotide-binding universal stress UspA family protein